MRQAMKAAELGSMYCFAIAVVVMLSYCIHYKLQQPAMPIDQAVEEYQVDADPVDGKLTARSGKWKAVRDEFIRNNPSCAACGSRKNLNAHHIKPYHEHPELELDPSNLIALCGWQQNNCHLKVGHDPDGPSGPAKPNWNLSNPNVVQDASMELEKRHAGKK